MTEGENSESEEFTETVEPYEFDLELPAISAKDYDIIKLTAMFTARCGNSFPATILKRESTAYQFNFLKTSHSLHPLFNKLVDHYSKTILSPKPMMDKITKYLESKYNILDSLMVRVRYEQYKRKQHTETEKEIDKERTAYASVDWYDFVVIGTVEFVEADEELDLAMPLKLDELKVMSLTEKKAMFSFSENKPITEEQDIEVDDSDDEL